MKIKRYFAADMRQAIRMVREAQGPDAVILSNRRVDGGVEIVAAVDYDETVVRNMAAPAKAPEATPEPASAEPEKKSLGGPEFSRQLAEKLAQQLAADPHASLAAQAGAVKPVQKSEISIERPEVVWSQEPVLAAMREEIATLRGMLEGQLSGLAWGEQRRRHPLRIKLLERLMQLGLDRELCRELAEKVEYGRDPEQNWKQALGLLARDLTVSDDDILSEGGVIALVGATGVGKTTTIAKLAARYMLRHGANRVALVTTDSFRIGAHQQLRTYGQILGLPVYIANDSNELRTTLDGLRDKDLVLIDTAGMSQRDLRLHEQFELLRGSSSRIKSYAVLSTTTQRVALDETLRALEKVELSGCILTKTDETVALGEALSVVRRHRLPVAYVCDGQRVPEDIHPARAAKLVSQAVALMRRFEAELPEEDEMAIAFAGKGAMHG